jgi:transcription elongation GreA/GreB family factor
MNKCDLLIEKYTKQIAELEKVLINKRLSIGEADSGKESRFPTQRVELEDAIQQLQNKLYDLKNLLKSLKELPENFDSSHISVGCTVSIEINKEIMEFILVPSMGDFSLGLLSLESALGKAIFGKKVGDTVSINEGSSAKILSIL